MACCNFSEIDLCDVISSLPVQYRASKNLHSILNVWVDAINSIYRTFNNMCGLEDCSDLSSDALTNYGNSVGFPRAHCNGSCDFEGDFVIEDDDFYCSMIQAHLISRSGATIDNLCSALRLLFGEGAFIISSKDGVTKVSSGRVLYEREYQAINIIKKVLPRQCGTSIEIYDIVNLESVVGVECGDCTNFADSCAGASSLCDPISCQSDYVPDPNP